MNHRSSHEPTKTQIFVWAIQKLSADDFHFTPEGPDGGWELNMWDFPEADVSAEEADVLKKVAQAVVDGRVEPEIVLRLAKDSSELPELERLSALFRTSLKAALGHCLLDARRRLGAGSAAKFETIAIQSASQEVNESIAVSLLGEIGTEFAKMTKRAEELRVLGIEFPASEGVQRYVDECSRCYIHGRYLASLLVCRAAIELALKDFLNRSGRKQELLAIEASGKDGLVSLIKLVRFLNNRKLAPTMDDATEVRLQANAVAHKGALNSELCKELIVKTRGVLRELYS